MKGLCYAGNINHQKKSGYYSVKKNVHFTFPYLVIIRTAVTSRIINPTADTNPTFDDGIHHFLRSSRQKLPLLRN